LSLVLSCTEQKQDVHLSYKIKWAIAHAPVKYFSKAAEKFKEMVESETNGKIQVEISTQLANQEHTSGVLATSGLIGKIQRNEIEMGQVYTSTLADIEPEFSVFDLPFLFEGDRHVDRVVEGEIGAYLMAGLPQHGLKGLGFTYSGGKIGLVSHSEPITKFSQLKGLRYRSFSNKVNQDFVKELGYQNYPSSTLHNGKRLLVEETLDANLVDAADVTYADAADAIFKPGKRRAKYFSQTGHAWLLTTLVMNKSFFDKLPVEYQEIVEKAARRVARLERQHIVSDAQEIMKRIQDDLHSSLVDFPIEEKLKMKEAAMPVYRKYEKVVGKQLIRKIQSLAPIKDQRNKKMAKN